MLENGFINQQEYDTAVEMPLDVIGRDDQQSPAPYFVEWIRQGLTRDYSNEEIWEGGLQIYTTLDMGIQKEAQRALRKGLIDYDRKNRGWAGPVGNILDEGLSLEEYKHPDWSKLFYKDQMIHGLVLQSSNAAAEVRLGSYTANLTLADMAWTKSDRVNEVLKSGDVALFTLREVDRASRIIKADLVQIPEVQGSIIVLDNKTGAIRAMVGGFDFTSVNLTGRPRPSGSRDPFLNPLPISPRWKQASLPTTGFLTSRSSLKTEWVDPIPLPIGMINTRD